MRVVPVAVMLAVALFVASGAASQSRQTQSFTIVAGRQFGPIRETTTRAELAALFRGAVKDGDVYLGEGFCVIGTMVLPGTADEIEVAWQDEQRSRVAFIRATKPGGRWRTSRGVRIGTTLQELVKMAGQVLTFSGFGWDYGGGLGWNELSGSIGLRLMLHRDEALAKLPRVEEIHGDRDVRSDHPVVSRARITVAAITAAWGNYAGEHDCG